MISSKPTYFGRVITRSERPAFKAMIEETFGKDAVQDTHPAYCTWNQVPSKDWLDNGDIPSYTRDALWIMLKLLVRSWLGRPWGRTCHLFECESAALAQCVLNHISQGDPEREKAGIVPGKPNLVLLTQAW